MDAAAKWEPYLVTGVPVAAGEPIPNRKEIRQLSRAELYVWVKGLELFQREDHTDPLSYFQLAGIHGLPYQKWPSNDAWDGIPVRELDLTNEKEFGGFCTHSSILFLTWHRPYLALFESCLYKHVQEAARSIRGTDDDKREYLLAARTSACHIGTGRFRRTKAPSSRSSRWRSSSNNPAKPSPWDRTSPSALRTSWAAIESLGRLAITTLGRK